MKKANIILSCIILLFVSIVTIIVLGTKNGNNTSAKPQAEINRQTLQLPIIATSNQTPPSIAATKLPQFTYSLADQKFDSIVTAASDKIKDLIEAKFVHTAYAQESIDAKISIDKEKRELIVQPKSIPNFTPGMYKLSLTLRTLEGNVNVDQDFTWGVIAVNTNKSIYKLGETAKIGIGVLNDKGDTLCMTGLFNRVDELKMVITDPQGHATNLSIEDKTILDSGKCGPNTVTNEADFKATYPTTTPGIYQMTVTAVVYGKTRQIEDYFKVDPKVQFDVERTSFPTRIFPSAIYPGTFTITATQDNNGTVEDTVPSFFGIEHISDNGTMEKDGEFTKIIWKTNLKAGVAKTFTYFIHFPRVSPEFYLLGPIKIGDPSTNLGHFVEARQWQIASDAISSATGVVSYEDNTTQSTFYRTWSGTTFSTQGTMSTGTGTPTNSKWFSEKSSPLTGEKLDAVLDADTADTIYIYRWTGSTWVNDIKITMTGNTISNQSRCVDVAFDQVSGDAIFVYANSSATAPNNNKIFYRKYNHSTNTWDASDSVISTATAPKAWIKLVAQKNSDTILMGYVNTSNNHVGAMVWNGASWGNEIIDDAAHSPTAASGHIDQTFDVAWETNSGTGMLVWGNTSGSLTYLRFTGSAWTSETTSSVTFASNVDWVNAASDDSSSSNNIAIATQDLAATPNCDFTVWNGSAWSQDTAHRIACRAHATTGGGSSRENNVVFEHGTGKAVWVYITSADLNHLHYRTWSGSTFTADAVTNATAPGGALSTIPAIAVNLYSDANTISIIAVYTFASASTSTATVQLWDQEWDGGSWTAPGANNSTANTNLFANVQAADEHAEAYGFGFDLNLETLAAYKWFADTPGTDASVNSALTSQDTPYTLTSANQKFRLRVLLYYSDSLTAGSRTYNLQYVDPGTGTCANPSGGTPSIYTTVPTSGGTTISFYDNSTVSNNIAILANSSLDPTYSNKTKVNQTYNEQNTFTTNTNVSGGNVGLFDFSLIDNTTFDRTAQSYCFQVARSNGLVLKINGYPQMTTAALNDVLIQGGSLIQGGTTLK
ncbi:MAG TPA: hypothetical protein VLG12_06910 [Candidatus Saccharimonadales bacterium]|nr:hypothetical protein [Candidatus Saccharimonadales bacterium]